MAKAAEVSDHYPVEIQIAGHGKLIITDDLSAALFLFHRNLLLYRNISLPLPPPIFTNLLLSTNPPDSFRLIYFWFSVFSRVKLPRCWGAADAEIRASSDENTELKGSPFKA